MILNLIKNSKPNYFNSFQGILNNIFYTVGGFTTSLNLRVINFILLFFINVSKFNSLWFFNPIKPGGGRGARGHFCPGQI